MKIYIYKRENIQTYRDARIKMFMWKYKEYMKSIYRVYKKQKV